MKKWCVMMVCTIGMIFSSSEVFAVDPLAAAAGGEALQQVAPIADRVLPIITNTAGTLFKTSFSVVKNALGVLWLPVGVVETTVGAPFGFFGHGVTNIVDGVAAPFRVAGDVIALPVDLVKGVK